MTATYYGATAGATLANPPLELTAVVGGQVPYGGDLSTRAMGLKVWFYTSTNTAADMTAVGVISDGGKLGMTPGDILLGVFNGGAPVTGAHASSMHSYMGMLTSTESSISTGAYKMSSNYST